MAPSKKEIQIVKMNPPQLREEEAVVDSKVPKETTVPLAVQPKNIRDTAEISTPHSKKKQIIATFCATLGCYLNGTVLGYSAPALPSLLECNGHDLYGNHNWSTTDNGRLINSQQGSWITGILSLGCFFGCILAGPMMEKFGRKKTLMYFTSLWFFLGYLLIFLANNIAQVYIGRFLGGMGLGFELAVATVYIVEIASTDMRGILGCFVQFMGSFGVLFTYILGSFLNWYWLAMVNGLTVIIFVIGMAIAPESPRWLILKGHEYSAHQSLEWLRGRENPQADAAVDREIEKIKRDIAAKRKQKVSLTQLKSAWKPFCVSLGMMFLLQFSGLNILVFYAVNIFEISSVSLDSNLASVIVGITLLISCVVALAVVSRLNRKIMLVTSMLFMGICHITLGMCFYVQENELTKNNTNSTTASDAFAVSDQCMVAGGTTPPTPNEILVSSTLAPFSTTLPNGGGYDHRPAVLGWLPLVAVIVFLFMGNIGYGTLIWVVTAELLPPKVRSISNSIIICFAFLCGFFISKTFVDLLEGIGQDNTFFLYGGICIVGTLLTALFVPETRGKSIDEIQRFFTKSRARPDETQVESTPLRTIRT